MSDSRLSFGIALAVAGALACVAGCKSSTENSCGSGTPPSLVGTYNLQSLIVSGTPITPETGTLQFLTSTFTIDMSGSYVFADTGSYVVSGSRCLSENGRNSQFIGTFSLVGTTLSVSGSYTSQAVTSVWTKTP